MNTIDVPSVHRAKQRFIGAKRDAIHQCLSCKKRLSRCPGVQSRDEAQLEGVPEDGRLPFDDCYPALIEWLGGLKPQDRLADSGCRLTRLEVAHPQAAAIAALVPLADPRLVFTTGEPALRAAFSTPHGPRVLE